MANQALTFNNITLSPIAQNDGQIWLTASDLSKALGYSRTDKVTELYNRNSDEFSDKMTLTLKMGVNGINGSTRQKETRIFSLRGCHLIAMFSRTAIAKQFRVWVLNILDKEVGQPTLTRLSTVADRKPLVKAVKMLVDETGAIYSNVWKMVHQRFNVKDVEELTAQQVPMTIEYVHSLFMQTITKHTEPTTPQETNEVKMFWKCVGLNQYHETSKALDELKKALWQAEDKLKAVNKSRSLIYDALSEPKHPVGGQSKVQEINQKALAFIQRQNALKSA